MKQWLNHWGNLTLLTKTDNASLQNSVFGEKLIAVFKDNSNLLFNRLLGFNEYRGNLQKQAWGPRNCQKRLKHLVDFADCRWGTQSLLEYNFNAEFEPADVDVDDSEDATSVVQAGL